VSTTALWRAFTAPSYPIWLFGVVLVWLGLWSIKPPHPADFALEHILTVLLIGLLVATRRRFPLSHLSYSLIALFLLLHAIGAHYTYSEVPYERWFATVASWLGADHFSFDGMFGFERNQFDRLVHFAFGLLFAYPTREVFLRIAKVKGFWGYFLPVDVMLSCSLLYELIEWVVALVMSDGVGQSYLGTQGDVWDAQKDMAIAALGGLIAMGITAVVNLRRQPDFTREFRQSLTVSSGPLGENALKRR
jgi:putative membrane protein